MNEEASPIKIFHGIILTGIAYEIVFLSQTLLSIVSNNVELIVYSISN